MLRIALVTMTGLLIGCEDSGPGEFFMRVTDGETVVIDFAPLKQLGADACPALPQRQVVFPASNQATIHEPMSPCDLACQCSITLEEHDVNDHALWGVFVDVSMTMSDRCDGATPVLRSGNEYSQSTYLAELSTPDGTLDCLYSFEISEH